jgi:GTPase SAR1 family protein
MSNAVTVVVRVRPLSPKEVREKSNVVIAMEDQQTVITDPTGKQKPHSFNFDESFWSTQTEDAHFCDQLAVYKKTGAPLLGHVFQGYNACLFAYGQTGSGKTYSMMGYGEDRGVIPQLCAEMFELAAKRVEEGNWAFQAQVTYLEIYNEKCRCLLSPDAAKKEFKVREHPTTGPYVENLTRVVVHNFDDIERIMEDGNKMRTVASTAMNATSSRSHAIFTITFTQKTNHEAQKATSEMSSKLNLVDLAGSERADRTGATGDTLKEGSNINKSLTTLGKVIQALAEGTDKNGKFKKHVPFRDSSLTWLLKDNLCGNSKTTMLAALSPADSNFDETLSTLRYADRAKQLRTAAVVNEDPKSKRIREMEEEITLLKAQLASAREASPEASGDAAGGMSPRGAASPTMPQTVDYEALSMKEKLRISTKLLEEENMTWEDNDRETLQVHAERAKAFVRQGVGITVNKELPSLVNLNEDPTMSECLVYCLGVGNTSIGAEDVEAGDVHDASIVLQGANMLAAHAVVEVAHAGGDEAPEGEEEDRRRLAVSIAPQGAAQIRVNGTLLTAKAELAHGARVIFGDYHVFRFSNPTTAEPRHASPAKAAGEGQREGTSPEKAEAGASQYHKAMEERFEAERTAWMATVGSANGGAGGGAKHADPVANSSFAVAAQVKEDAMRVKITELQARVDDMETNNRTNLHQMYMTQTSVSGAATSGKRVVGAIEKEGKDLLDRRSALESVAQVAGNKAQRLPPQCIFKHRIVLVGHQEVGKTSLRKCFQSDPMFFKKLPDVQATTGIEAQVKQIKIGAEVVDLTIQDFAGQESYHSHSLFLTQRTVFLLVWKISAVEQDFFSKGIDDAEEARMCRWISEVYSKFPTAPIALVATHLDELRDQSPRVVSAILAKVEKMATTYIESIARTDITDDLQQAKKAKLLLVGNFAVSCKNRVVTSIGKHANLAGQKVSALLNVLGQAALDNCKADPVFWGGAIPGRHVRLIQEVEAAKKATDKLLMPLSEYVHMAVRIGIESDKELLEVTQLMHSWNVLFMFNQQSISENPFLFLHPVWLSRMAGVLFSFAHVINTPLHLRSVIGGLEYNVSAAEDADMGLLACGFLRLPLARVIFHTALASSQHGREPSDQDVDTALKVLDALEVLTQVAVPSTDADVVRQETPQTMSVRGRHHVVRYFVPSLSPFPCPADLVRIAPLLFNRGVHVRFVFNLLPNELWRRIQFRLHKHICLMNVHSPRERDDDDYVLKEACEVHNMWNDAMWLGNANSRVLLLRDEGDALIRVYSAEVASEASAEAILQDVEGVMSELLKEYRGIRRELQVACPAQHCDGGWLDLMGLPQEGHVQCTACSETYPADAVVVSGTGQLGPKVFPEKLTAEVMTVLRSSLDGSLLNDTCDFFGISTSGQAMFGRDRSVDDVAGEPAPIDFLAGLDKVVRLHMLQAEAAKIAAEAASKPEDDDFWN